MFENARFFAWDVSRVKDLTGLFKNAQSFNQPLNEWETSMVTNM